MRNFNENYAEILSPMLRSALDRQKDPKGIWCAFTNEKTIVEMERLARAGRPPVIAAEGQLLKLGEWVRDDDAKRVFGRLAAHFAIERFGFVQGKSGIRTPESQLFTKGTLFHAPVEQSGNAEGQAPSFAAITDSAVALTTELLRLAAIKYSYADMGRLVFSDCAAVRKAIEILK